MLDKLIKYLKLKKKELLSAAASILAVALLYLFFHLVGIGCPIHFLTGVSCPGCGMTRAVISVLRLHFAEAYHYHPLVYLLPFALGTFLFKKHITKNFYKILIFFASEIDPLRHVIIYDGVRIGVHRKGDTDG